jgi:hypothetical protein
MTIKELTEQIDILEAKKSSIWDQIELKRLSIIEDLTKVLGLPSDTKIVSGSIDKRRSNFEVDIVDSEGNYLFGHGLTIYYDIKDGVRMSYGTMGSFYAEETTRIRHCQNLGLVATKLPELNDFFKEAMKDVPEMFREFSKLENKIEELTYERRILEVEGEKDVTKKD